MLIITKDTSKIEGGVRDVPLWKWRLTFTKTVLSPLISLTSPSRLHRIAYLAILIGAGWMCLDVSKRAKTAWMRDAARGLGAGQLAFLIFGMGDAIPLGGKNGVFFWVSLALIAAMYNYVNRRSEIVDKEAQARGSGHNLSVTREDQRT